MLVHQVPVRHPLLRTLADLLADEPRRKAEVVGNFETDVAAPPSTRRGLAGWAPESRISAALRELETQAKRLVPPSVEVRAAWYYPENGGMGWHTNSDAPGWRAYVVRVPEDARSFTRTLSGDFHDKFGYANLFRIEGPQSWHCVVAPTERWSIGVHVPDALAAELLRA